MIDPVSAVLAVGLAVGWVTSLVTGRAVRRANRRIDQLTAPPPAPICPCGHVISMHEDSGTGACMTEIARPHYYDNGDRNGHEYVPCPCLQYMGPELLRDVMHRGVTPAGGYPQPSLPPGQSDE